jgi:dephospho-CoA kinase
MITLGLTGSIGMGKSEAAKSFAKLGIPVFDSDACVHNIFHNNDKLKQQIKSLFPEAVENNQINRQALGQLVFGSTDKIKQLESLVHPLVLEEQKNFSKQQEKNGASLIVFDIPLLFETGGFERMDKTLVVSAPKDIQEQRVLERPNMTKEKFAAILAKQMSDEEKTKRADFVISSANGKEAMQKDIESLIKQLTKVK